MDKQEKIEKEKEIVIARLETASSHLSFFDGGDERSYSRDDIIRLIKENDTVGLDYVRAQFEFLRAVASGEVQKQIADILG